MPPPELVGTLGLCATVVVQLQSASWSTKDGSKSVPSNPFPQVKDSAMRTLRNILPIAIALSLGFASAAAIFRNGRDHQARAASPPEIILYSEPDFQGYEVRIHDSEVDLPYDVLEDGAEVAWNDAIRSFVVVSGTWRIYQHGRLNTLLDDTPRELLDLRTKQTTQGWSTVVSATSRGPLRIASVELAGVGPDISSVELVSPENLPDWVYRGK